VLSEKCNSLEELSKCNVTSAKSAGFEFFAPLKITSVEIFPLNALLDFSPKTHLIASMMFDFPEPFGPITPVTGFVKLISVLVPNDLKPFRTIFFKNISYIL
jgi:hypothetical protein